MNFRTSIPHHKPRYGLGMSMGPARGYTGTLLAVGVAALYVLIAAL